MKFTDQYIKMCDCDEVDDKLDYNTTMPIHGENQQLNEETGTIVFVPYQHQIQSFIFQYGSCQYKLLTDFYDWCKEYRSKDINMVKGCTLEELWLMFYMWRDHYKVWDGEKWVKE